MSRLSPAAQSALTSHGRRTDYPAGVSLLHQGDRDTDVLLLENVRSGPRACVKIVVTSEDGDESLLGLRTSGDVVGELASVCRAPRTATVTTCTATAVWRFSQAAFQGFLTEWPDAHRELVAMIADRLNGSNRRRHEFTQYPVSVRLARMIIEIAKLFGHTTERGLDVGIPLSQREWGQLIGGSEVAVRQAMRRLRRESTIENRYCQLVITNFDLLLQHGCIVSRSDGNR